MAQVFKNYTQASIGTSPATVYTVAGGTTAIVIGLNLANRTASTITASAQIGSVYIIKDAPIPSGGALSCLLYTSPSPRDKRQSRMPSSA